ncbi:hypothetical protein BDR07DRAFT_1547515 [Suillus spraguei]|nr:hypothetical protein BDR07DRAFT_1547515 [Suillus spraguei]
MSKDVYSLALLGLPSDVVFSQPTTKFKLLCVSSPYTRHLSCPVRVPSEASLRNFRCQEVWHWLRDDDGGRRIVLLVAEAKHYTITLRLSMRPNQQIRTMRRLLLSC